MCLLPLQGCHYEQSGCVVDASKPHHVTSVVKFLLSLDLFEHLSALLTMETSLEVVQNGELSADGIFEPGWLSKQQGISRHFINDVLKETDLLLVFLTLKVTLIPINKILPLKFALLR